jgi:hypothetical protein
MSAMKNKIRTSVFSVALFALSFFLFTGAALADAAVTDVVPHANALANNVPAFLEAEFTEDVSFVSMTLDNVSVSAESHGDYILSNQSLGNLTLGIHTVSVVAQDTNGNQIEAAWSFKLLPTDTFVTFASLFAGEPATEVVSDEADATINISVNGDTRIFIAPASEPAANSGLLSIGKFVEIAVSDISAVNFPVVLKVFYTGAEAAGIDKSTLKIYFFDQTSGSWQVDSTSTVDILNNFVSASPSHFSIYGVYGSAHQSQPPSSNTGGSNNAGNGGFGGSTSTTMTGTNQAGVTVNTTQQCQELWVCGDWSECKNDTQTRVCNDQNNCGTNNEEPLTSQSCSKEGTTQAWGSEARLITEIAIGIAVALIIIFMLKRKNGNRKR